MGCRVWGTAGTAWAVGGLFSPCSHTPHVGRHGQKPTEVSHLPPPQLLRRNHIPLPTAKPLLKQEGSIPDPSFGGGSKLSCFASARGFPALLSGGAVVNNSPGGCYSPCASHPPTPPGSSAFMPFWPSLGSE